MEAAIQPLFLLLFLILLLLPVSGDDATAMSKLAGALSPAPRGWSGNNPCKWPSVSCDSSGRVSSINLSGRGLSGSLPSELNQLSSLKSLALQKNKLSGSFPSLANLSSLQEVFLDDNGFSSVPSSFLSGLTSLQSLSLDENPSLPSWTLPDLSQSSALVNLTAAKANLYGPLPDFFGALTSLQSLRLSYNNFTGFLPASFANSSIQNLWLNNQANGLSGKLDVLATMPQLRQVWLHVNKFSGPIPDLGNSDSLIDLQLRDNQLTGVVPPSLTSLPNLANVSLQNNMLQGPVPEFRSGVNIEAGEWENSYCNSNKGEPCDPQVTALLAIAGAFGYPTSLAESWKGNDPCNKWTFITCTGKSVSSINFGKQQFTGTISPAIANLTSLRTLFLNDNDLSGSIPDSLTSLKQLQTLDVSNNNLSGKIPNFPTSVNVKAAGNPLLGTGARSTPGGGAGGPPASGGNAVAPAGNATQEQRRKRLVIVASTVAVGVFVLIVGGACLLWLFFWKRQPKKIENPHSPEEETEKRMIDMVVNTNGGGFGGEQLEKGDVEKVDVYGYDGGNVAIPIEVLRQVTKDFRQDNILGKGGFGIVYKGELHDGTQLAVKRMEPNAISSKGIEEFEAEIAVLSKVRHRHLVALLGFCINGNERLLVYEYMPQGTLAQHLFEHEKHQFAPLTWKQRVTIALDVARGVEYLHSLAQKSFIHRDLKPSNVLLGDDMRAKVSDFGLVRKAPDEKYSLETRLAGTFGYLAPEYASTGRVTTKVDVFAFGVVLMEMLTAQKALDESLPEEKSHLVTWFRRVLISKDSIRNSLDPSLDANDEETFESICKVAELAGHCTTRDPHQRPDIGYAVNVLAPLVQQWKLAGPDDEDSFSIDLHMSLPQALQRWQAGEGTTTMEDGSFYNQSSISSTRQSPVFERTITSNDGR